MTTPKTTLSGTTIATMSSERLSAEIAAGVRIDSRKVAEPRLEGAVEDDAGSAGRAGRARRRARRTRRVSRERRVVVMSCAPRDAARGCPTAGAANRVRKEMASSATDTAAALAGRSISICCWMYCETTCVSCGMLPPMSTTEPYSPTARAKARPAPLMMAGARVGRTTSRNVVAFEAPRDAAASSTSRSSSMSTGCTERTTNGQRDEGQRDGQAPASGVEVQRRSGCSGRRARAARCSRRSSAARTAGR